MEIIKALKWRYATKRFDPKRKVSSEKISIIKEAFNLSPSSYGLQPIRLVIVENQELKYQLMQYGMGQKQIATASHVLVLCVETVIDEQYVRDHFEREKNIRDTPDEILAPYRTYLIRHFEEKDTDFTKQWALNQAYLALGTLLTVCALEEIDACPIEGFEPQKYDEILQLKEKNLQSVLVLPIGYRAEDDIFSDFKKVRKPLDDSILEF
ncbi:MAG TPA: NAD(P)H-dependent oxidoreductase [Salinimicrobium sp.]|nr:NAD(P)H-dependent oxidoreductase [Salinimicrobium sp.]